MNPFLQYFNRYQQIKADLKSDYQLNDLTKLLEQNTSALNNFFMAGLGMGTLFLRMGAVIQMSQRLHDGNTNNDALFLKQVMDNLRETLPSDSNWKNLWYFSMQPDSVWSKAVPMDKSKNSKLDRFVTFRNKYVHQLIRLVPEQIKEIQKGIDIMDEMAQLYELFQDSEIVLQNQKYYWQNAGLALELHPFVQSGNHEGLPYLFQGLYDNKSKAKFINTIFGDETEPNANVHLDDKFQPMQMALKAGAGQVFDHSDRLNYYLDCFVGRDREVESVLNWIKQDSEKNTLPIYSEAGMGKGALTAKIIDVLIAEQMPVMYHFCGSGMANSLHAVLYHFILQGKSMPGMSGDGVWKIENESIQRKMERLPSRYFDAIKLFQNLLTEAYKPSKKFEGKPLVIVVDGLDEAAVSNSQLKISDWFYTYNEKDEVEADWIPPGNIKWVFTYRSLATSNKGGFQLGGRFSIETNELVQPLKGLSEEAVRLALKDFEVSEEFVQTVIERGAVV